MLVTPQTIRITAIALSLIGLVATLAFSVLFEPQEISLKEIDAGFEGKAVKSKGFVRSSFKIQNTLITELFDGKKFKAVKFNPTWEEQEALGKNSFVEVEGKVQKYNGELEIVIARVRKIA